MNELKAIVETLRQRHIRRKADVILMRVRMDAEEEPDRWITTEEGHHVPLDENGIALAGGGGTLKGVDFSRSKSTESASEKKTTSTSTNARIKTPKVENKQAASASGKKETKAEGFHRGTKEEAASLKTLEKGAVVEFKSQNGSIYKYTAIGGGDFESEDYGGKQVSGYKTLETFIRNQKGWEVRISGGEKPETESEIKPDVFHTPSSKEIASLSSLPKGTVIGVMAPNGNISGLETNGHGGVIQKQAGNTDFHLSAEQLFTLLSKPGHQIKMMDKDEFTELFSKTPKEEKGAVSGQQPGVSTKSPADKSGPASVNVEKRAKSVVFSPDESAFSDDRKKNAIRTDDPRVADDLYREEVGKVYQELDDITKNAFSEYTDTGYKEMNASLRETHGRKIEGFFNSYRRYVDAITDTIAKFKIKKDTVLPRGVGWGAANDLFGFERGFLEQATDEQLQALVGKTGTDKGFMSCGSALGRGMRDKVNFNLYCPEGTVGMYVEPFSECGDGAGMNWDERSDGKSKQDTFSREDETILQRGTTVRITGIRRNSDGSLDIDAEVIKQEVEELPEY